MKHKYSKHFFILALLAVTLFFGYSIITPIPAHAETINTNIDAGGLGPIDTGNPSTPSTPPNNTGALGEDITQHNIGGCQDPSGGSCVTTTSGGANNSGVCDITDPNYARCITKQNCFIGFGLELGLCGSGTQQGFGGYLQRMYQFLLAFVAIAAFGGITYGGLLYVFAAGSIGRVDEAKKWIWNALIGLLVTAISFILLSTINPDLVKNFTIDLSKYKTTPPAGTTAPPTTQGPPPGAGSACGVTLNACPGGYQCIFDSAGNGTCQPTGT